jgi:F-type H+-transporting ATPase subunit gamma
VGRKPPTFGDASVIALELLNSGYEFDEGSIIFNQFRQATFRIQSFFVCILK